MEILFVFLVAAAAAFGFWLAVGGDERDEVINNFILVPNEVVEEDVLASQDGWV